jgi:putative flippase GtrA
VELTQSDREPSYVSDDRRSGVGRRQADRAERMRELAAFAVAMCGGLAVLYVFFVAIGTVDVGDAMVATIGAIVLALIWLIAFWRRMKTNALVAQRPDRERRGF